MILDVLSWILLVTGGLFCVLGGVGILRFPDFYTRTHAASLTDTLGAGLMLVGMMLQGGLSITTAKLVMLLIFTLIASPTAAHALVKAAYAHGVRWEDRDAD